MQQPQPARTYQVGPSTLSLVFGSITTSTADVLVSSDDSDLSMGGGVSAAIRRAAGQSLLLEVAKKIPAKLGDVVVTGAGSLRAKHVFHAVTLGDAGVDGVDVVTNCTRRAIALLRALGLSSIAFPAIGAGVAGIPYEDVAVNMAEVLVDELSKSPEALSVTIYLFDRFGQMQPIDYVQFFEEFASRTRGLSSGDTKRGPAKRASAKPRLATVSKRKSAAATKRTGALAELADLDRERESLEERLAQYGGALPRAEVRKTNSRLKLIQLERVKLLSAVRPKPLKAVPVFVSYSRADDGMRKELGKQLSVLQHQGIVSMWHDRLVEPGTDWTGVIDERLNEARVILLLISSDFLDSTYCREIEMTRAMERHESRKALVIPIILRAVHMKGVPFAKLQALPQDAKPVSMWTDRDSAYVNIVDGVRSAIEDLVRGD